MAERVGDHASLARLAVNRPVLSLIEKGAERSADGIGPWSPDGYVMRTHPDLSETIAACAPDDLRIVLGVATLVTPADVIYAVGWGTSAVWLRIPSGPALSDALLGDEVEPVEGSTGWVRIRAWRDDLAAWIRASAILTADLPVERA